MSADLSDVGRPFVIQLSEAGELGGNITALIPHKDGYMLAATSSSLWVVQGDPTADGGMRNISRDVGIVGARAWCRDHLDRYYFMSSHGLYTVGASGEGLQALSEDIIPEQLTGVTDINTVLEYDHALRGVYIHIPDSVDIDGDVTSSDYTVTEGDTVTLTFTDTSTPTEEISWLFETENQAFWPFRVGYAGSHVAMGPVRLNDGDTFGRLLRLHGITAASSANVTWRVIVADTAEQVSARAKAAIETLMDAGTPTNIHSSGTWTAGVNHRTYPRARGLYMILLLSSSGTWGWEGAVIRTEPSGAWR
jgi:hypothetical protein